GKDLQKIVYLSDAGPVVIDLRLRIDGKPFRSAWRAFIDSLFDSLDIDKDGVLSPAEAAKAPPAESLASPNAFTLRAVNGRAVLDANGDGKVTREELAEHYRTAGLSPFQLTFSPRQTGYIVLTDGVMNNRPSADALNARLFKLLDTDGDG